MNKKIEFIIKKLYAKDIIHDTEFMKSIEAMTRDGFDSATNFASLINKVGHMYAAISTTTFECLGYQFIKFDTYEILQADKSYEKQLGIYFSRLQISPLYHENGIGNKIIHYVLHHFSEYNPLSLPMFVWFETYSPYAYNMVQGIIKSFVGQKLLEPFDRNSGEIYFSLKSQNILSAITKKIKIVGDSKFPFLFHNFATGYEIPSVAEQKRIDELIAQLPEHHIFKQVKLNIVAGDSIIFIAPNIVQIMDKINSKL